LGGQRGEAEWLTGIAVVPRREELERHDIGDHAVLHDLLEPVGQVLEDQLADGVDGVAAVGRQFRQVLVNGLGFALHDAVSWLKHLAPRRKVAKDCFFATWRLCARIPFASYFSVCASTDST